jgi:hypothetical protein
MAAYYQTVDDTFDRFSTVNLKFLIKRQILFEKEGNYYVLSSPAGITDAWGSELSLGPPQPMDGLIPVTHDPSLLEQ